MRIWCTLPTDMNKMMRCGMYELSQSETLLVDFIEDGGACNNMLPPFTLSNEACRDRLSAMTRKSFCDPEEVTHDISGRIGIRS
jgi:hypothetical protein